MKTYEEMIQSWKKSWELALTKWTKFTRLREPYFITNSNERKEFSTGDLFAMIRLTDQTIFIDIPKILELGLEDYPLEIFCHEIGHHIAYPSNLTDMGKMLMRIKKALTFPSLAHFTNFVGNVYTDLLINHKLKVEFELKIEEVYKKLKPKKVDEFWNFYMRIYELLWALPKGTLTFGEISQTMEADAMLGNRLIRNYATNWIHGAGKFACLCIPYLMDSKNEISQKTLNVWLDNYQVNDKNCNKIPEALFELDDIDPTEIEHPASTELDEEDSPKTKQESTKISSYGNSRIKEPYEITEVLNQLGLHVDQSNFTITYYKQLALPYLIPFPKKLTPQAKESILEGTEIWDVSSPTERINWFQTAIKSPVPIPGYTILEDYFGEEKGDEVSYEEIDLDIYVDCSGSMPNPSHQLSYLALAGTIITLSALRAGSKVQATLWSGKNQVHTTEDFINDEEQLLKVITGYIGGGTEFPIHILNDTYLNRKPSDRKVHILMISDEGIDTMLRKEKNYNGEEISKMAIQNSGGGATMVLNLYHPIEKYRKIQMLSKQGWDIYKVTQWDELLVFASKFVNKNYKR